MVNKDYHDSMGAHAEHFVRQTTAQQQQRRRGRGN